MLFASALQNFGVAQLLEVLLELAPAPGTSPALDGAVREVDDDFSAFVFKVQSGMDSAHRDRLAYARVCSGVFERGMIVTHGETGRPFATKYAQAVFGRERSSVETAFPGDVIGLVNANALRVGDTIYAGEPVRYPPIASFAPEHFATVRAVDSGRYKQFRSGIEQLDQEGVVQVLRSDLRGAPVAGPRRGRPDAVRGRAGPDGVGVQGAGAPRAARLQRGPAYRRRRRGRRSGASAASRCWPSPTAATSRCSPTSGAPRP